MRKASVEMSLGMLGFSMFSTLNFRCGTYECLHAHLALHSFPTRQEIEVKTYVNRMIVNRKKKNKLRIRSAPGCSWPSCWPLTGYLKSEKNEKREIAEKKKRKRWDEKEFIVPLAGLFFSMFLSRAILAFCPFPPPMAGVVQREWSNRMEASLTVQLSSLPVNTAS